MITLKELTVGESLDLITSAHLENLIELHRVMNNIRDNYKKPMFITSGYRSKETHERIYKKIGKPAPMGSLHLLGLACDVYDKDGNLNEWCKVNEKLLRYQYVFLENRQGTWVHFQIGPFKSYKPGGTIWFNP